MRQPKGVEVKQSCNIYICVCFLSGYMAAWVSWDGGSSGETELWGQWVFR